MPDSSEPLDYAVPGDDLRMRGKRSWLFYARFGVFLSLIALSVLWPYVTGWIGRWRHFRLDHAALVYVAPAGAVAYSDDPFLISSLSANARDYTAKQYPLPCVGFDPSGPLNNRPLWKAVAFLHGRAAAPNSERLVAIEVVPYDGGIPHEREVALMATTIEPTTLRNSGQCLFGASEQALVNLRDSDVLTVLMGLPDPNDSSHFTIELITNGTHQVIDGWLGANERIQLLPRSGVYHLGGGSPMVPTWWPTVAYASHPLFWPSAATTGPQVFVPSGTK